MSKKLLLVSAAFSVAVLTGCAPVLIGSAAMTGASVAADRRSAGAVANDGLIETKSALHLSQTNFSSSHITTTSYEGNVLLSGEVGTEDDKEKAAQIVKSINEVNSVYNELAVMPNSSFTSRMSDSITASKIRAALLDNKQVTLTSLKVVVERGVAYLIGAVTQQEAEIIGKIASKVQGVTRVVCLFTILTPEELEKRKLITNDGSSTAESGNGLESDSSSSYSTGAQATPIIM